MLVGEGAKLGPEAGDVELDGLVAGPDVVGELGLGGVELGLGVPLGDGDVELGLGVPLGDVGVVFGLGLVVDELWDSNCCS